MMVLEWPCVPSRVLEAPLSGATAGIRPRNRPAGGETGPSKSVPQTSNASTLSRIAIRSGEGCLIGTGGRGLPFIIPVRRVISGHGQLGDAYLSEGYPEGVPERVSHP